MLNRRRLLTVAVACTPALAAGARAATAVEAAAAFIKTTGDRLVAVINSSSSQSQRMSGLAPIIYNAVDVDGVARFCLGRFWSTATPQQQQQYLQLFREVLVGSIAARIGDYRGLTFSINRTIQQSDGILVVTTVTRPNNPPASLQWLVKDATTNPKIVDLIAEGTSLRITQRDDYSSFLAQHGFNIASLLDALRHQLSEIG
jgi:phospholipid transport system substrate-binding protein